MGQKVNPIGFRLGNINPTVLYADKDHKYLSQALTIQEIIEDLANRRGIIIYDFKFSVASNQIKILLKCFNTSYNVEGITEECKIKSLPIREIKACFQSAFTLPIKDVLIHELEDKDIGNDRQLSKEVENVDTILYTNTKSQFVFHIKKHHSIEDSNNIF